MLSPGLYEQVIHTALRRELSEIPDARKLLAPIDQAEASKVLAQYLADVVQRGLENVADHGGDISKQISLANQIVDLIAHMTQEADFAALRVDQRAEQLPALLREQDPRLAVGKTAADLSRPETSIAQSSLFTGAIHEPQMYTELKKEIVSADRIDMLVSFIKWSGLRLLMDELREFTQNGGVLRIITTSYMGATDVKAIEELRKLPNAKIKVSYDTKRTRLHAKTYVFYRSSGFTTAYVGSSNLSNSAISSGLEWNVKVTRRDLPETIDKIAATFESYWNSTEFEYYSEEQKERLARALKAEKYFDAINAQVYTMDIAPYSYQQEILDKLEAERTVRGYSHLDPRAIYKYSSFSRICARADVIEDFTEPLEEVLTKAFARLSIVDSRRWIRFLLDLLPRLENVDFAALSQVGQRMLQMFYVTVWGKAAENWKSDAVLDHLHALSDSPVLLGELLALLRYRYEQIDFIDEPVDLGFDCPLDLHCTYTRDQLLVALDFLKPATVREGVKWLPEKRLDVFFVTLNKADKDYSPTTMYRDYSISENLFHWQSQSTTAADSPTGQRYIHHRARGSKVLLFVREFKADRITGGAEAYTFLGTANYVKHSGSKPMNITWQLDRPIPAKFLKKTNKLVVG